MKTLMTAVLMVALCADIYSTASVTSTHTTEQDILKALKDFRRSFTSPAAKHSGNSLSEVGRTDDEASSGKAWRISDHLHLKTIGKRQDVTSYNLNSFGLRYGKRDQS
ncbi:metastasis-suppressor KiSS-1 [Halichoeres trimaculatus]|uniref:metastasis-suppressor KiSS-1 n=1 Tax=Halichoeres trimaculatus TaxID=147232 RepID=UPI003D9F6938